jgi:Flp pilus assembly protein TadG
MVPLFAFLFLLFSTAWVIFARSTLQNAVREGVRFGVTGQTLGSSCLGSSIQQVVYQYSFGFIPASMAAAEVQVTYYNPTTLAAISGTGATAGGNVLQVSVSGLSVNSFAPVWHSASPINLSASASDVLESPPNGILPCP